MKTTLFSLAALALLLSSCAKDTDNPETQPENLMRFGTFTPSMSKAVVPMGDNIMLYGVNKDANTTAWMFYQQQLIYSSTTVDMGNYTYSPLKYWPLSQTLGIDFYAWAPYSTATLLGGPGATIATTGQLTYTVPAAADEDLKMAKQLGVKKPTDKDRVTLVFEHMLSKVTLGTFEFQNVLEGYTATLTQVDLVGLANKATRLFDAAPTAAWDTPTGTAGNYSRTDLTKPYYILPQTFDNLDSLAFLITLKEPAPSTTTTTTRVAIALNDALKSNWQVAEKGKNYVLNLELDAHKLFAVINFEAQVNDWTDSPVTMPVVQPTAQKLNSMVNNAVLVIGGTPVTNKFVINGTITWNWSDGAIYKFNGLSAAGQKFKMTFAGVTFSAGGKVVITVPTGFRINLGADTTDQQTVNVTAVTDEVWITKK